MSANGQVTGILVVGTGFLGSQRAAACEAARGVRLVAVTDHDRDVARAVAHRHRALAIADLREALALSDVDAVVIATPPADHAGQVRLALEAGKHVLCEKPLAIDADLARELGMLADESRLRLATGMNHRFYPPVSDALGYLSAWAMGRVESVRVEIGHHARSDFLASWHTDPERSGGGTLMDNGPHACDLIRRIMGEVVAAKGYVRHALDLPEGCESEAFALFRNHDRAVGELRSSWTLEAGYLTLDIRGSEGHLRVETAPWRLAGMLACGKHVRKNYLAERGAEHWFRKRYGCEQSLVKELEAFVVTPSHHPRPGATGWDGCRATEMVQAVYESARTGEEVSLVPLPVQLPSLRRRALAKECT